MRLNEGLFEDSVLYEIKGYDDSSFRGLEESDVAYDLEDAFEIAWEYLSNGDYVEIVDTDTGKRIVWEPDMLDEFDGEFPYDDMAKLMQKSVERNMSESMKSKSNKSLKESLSGAKRGPFFTDLYRAILDVISKYDLDADATGGERPSKADIEFGLEVFKRNFFSRKDAIFRESFTNKPRKQRKTVNESLRKNGKKLNETLLDAVLDRIDGEPYNPREFYDYVNGWYNDVAHEMDEGEEEDVANAIIRGLKDSLGFIGSNPDNVNAQQLYKFVKDSTWLTNGKTGETPDYIKQLQNTVNESYKFGEWSSWNLNVDNIDQNDLIEYRNSLDRDKKVVFDSLSPLHQELLVAENKENGWFWEIYDGNEDMINLIMDLRKKVGTFDDEFDSSYEYPEDDKDYWSSYANRPYEDIVESINEDVRKEWKPNLNFKHIKDVLEKALSRGKYANNEREEVLAAIDLCDKKQKYTPEQRKFIRDSHEKMWRMNRNKSMNEDLEPEAIDEPEKAEITWVDDSGEQKVSTVELINKSFPETALKFSKEHNDCSIINCTAPLKGAQKEDGPEKVALTESEEADGLANLISNEINGEFETTNGYRNLRQVASEVAPDMLPVIDDIMDEENTHVGQLQTLLSMVDDSAENIDAGAEEAEDQLEDEDVEIEHNDEVDVDFADIKKSDDEDVDLEVKDDFDFDDEPFNEE